MILPDTIRQCIAALEQSGYAAYAVGGCVRDAFLGLTPKDYDLCTSALPQETEAVFCRCPLVLAGEKHGTVGVVTDCGVVEITTFRTEGDYRDSRHPDWVQFVPRVENDLARRDYTINAMAFSPSRGLADPFRGREDLEKKVLRAVGDPRTRFREDPLRILRGIRFAVRFHLNVDPETEQAMLEEAPLMENLARERVYDELCKLLPLVGAEDLIRFAPILAAVIPELGPMIGFDQRSPHHAYDLFTHTAHAVEGVPPELTLRWAALLHDVGKIPCFTTDETGRGHFYGHAEVGAELADGILRRLKAPNVLREDVVVLIRGHMARRLTKKSLRRLVSRMGFDMALSMLRLQEADMGSKGTGEAEEENVFPQLYGLLEEIRQEDTCLSVKDLAVDGNDLLALGLTGKAVGDALQSLLEQVLDEALPNEKEALLSYLRKQD